MVTEAELFALVKPQYHSAFKKFIDTGEANQDFLEYSRRDYNCKKAIDLAFIEYSRALEELACAVLDHFAGSDVQPLIDAVEHCKFSLT